MKAVIILCFLATLSQGHGGVVKMMEQELWTEIQDAVKEVVTEAQNLNKLIAETKQGLVAYFELHPITEISAWSIDYDECAELTETMDEGALLAWNATVEVYDLTTNISGTLFNLLSCPQINPIKGVECFFDDLKVIKSDLYSAKPMIDKYKAKIVDLFATLKEEYEICIGNMTPPPPTTKGTEGTKGTGGTQKATSPSPHTKDHNNKEELVALLVKKTQINSNNPLNV